MALALTQHAVFGIGQLVALGRVERTIQARAAGSRLHRIHDGVYSLVPPQLLSRDGRFMAAVLACGPGAALSHRSAGALRELIRSDRARIDVTVATRGGRRRAGIEIHRSATLRPADVAPAHGIPCTTVSRTLLDLAGVLDRRGLERALDQAAILELLDLDSLTDQIGHNAKRREAKRLRVALADHLPGSTPTWNEFEERFLRMARVANLPEPEVQQWLDLGDGEPMIRPDFMWRSDRVIVETDGWGSHRTRRSFENDRRRDQRAIAAGWRTVRVTWRQLTSEPDRLARTFAAIVSPTPEATPAPSAPPTSADGTAPAR